MEEILKEYGFRHIESEYQKGFFTRTYRKLHNGSKYIVRVQPQKKWFRIIVNENLLYAGNETEFKSKLESLKINIKRY